MAEPRKDRESKTRQTDTRKSDAWLPQSQLPMPKPRQGVRYKYIRIATLDKTDKRNASRRFREGWTPVKASEHPELEVFADDDSRWPEGVEIGGLLLCQISEEKADQRNTHYANAATAQLDSVERGFMNDQTATMPKHNDSKSRTTFGKGNG